MEKQLGKRRKDLKKKIPVLEKELQARKDEGLATDSMTLKLRAANRKLHARLWIIRQKHREHTDELQAVKKAIIQGFENYRPGLNREEGDTVFPKIMGRLDRSEDWSEYVFGICTSGDGDSVFAKGNEFVRHWEARVQDSSFDASIRKKDEDGNRMYTIKEENEELKEVLENYGPVVYEAVLNAHIEVKEYGFGTIVLWHYGENREATLSEVLENWSIHLEPKQ